MTDKKDAGQAEVQAAVSEAEDKGYYGSTPDPTPNEAYTLAGVNAGQATPETDDKAAAKARAALTQNRRR
ncbi:MAG TPA: hypothetical protein VFJ19_09360 [Nocardioidaceae bacterium]|nr:hypothetical protein [Nocardioidaceae bacterium]